MSYRPPPFTVCPDKLRRYRAERGFTQIKLAEASGVSKKTIYNIEHKRMRPGITTVALVAEALGVFVEQLLEAR